jgi:hypothetical protein
MPRSRCGERLAGEGALRDAPENRRVLGKIAKLEVFETETFPAEDVKLFLKELV